MTTASATPVADALDIDVKDLDSHKRARPAVVHFEENLDKLFDRKRVEI